MKNIFIVILVSFIYFTGLSQDSSQYSIDVFATPFVSGFTSIKKEYIRKTDDRIAFDENHKITNEIGLQILSKTYSKFNFGVGVSLKNYKYSFNTIFRLFQNIDPNSEFDDYDSYKYKNEITINTLGFRGLVKYKLAKNTDITFVLEFNKPLSIKYLNPLRSRFGVNDYVFSETASHNIESIGHYIVPEINFNTTIYKRLSIFYGFKLKLWRDGNNLYEFQIKHKDAHESFKIFDYRIDSRQVGFFLGLNYNFKLPKLKK